jgi:hypothetical protein
MTRRRRQRLAMMERLLSGPEDPAQATRIDELIEQLAAERNARLKPVFKLSPLRAEDLARLDVVRRRLAHAPAGP